MAIAGMPFVLIGLAFGFGPLRQWLHPGTFAAALLLGGNAALSAYHVGVESGWFALPGTCAAGGDATTIEELRAQLLAARPTCDRVALSVFGLSLAAWNGLAAAATAAFAALAASRTGRFSC